MKLESLNLYVDYKGKTRGTMKVSGRTGDISLNLTKEQCNRIMAPVMAAMVEEAREISVALAAELFEHSELDGAEAALESDEAA